MRTWPTRPRRTARIELIPMIDVMLFLLVFFVLISSNVLPALGLRVSLPQSGAPSAIAPQHHLTLTISAASGLYLDGQAVAVDSLAGRLAAARHADPTLAVMIAADKAAPLGMLVTVLDVLKGADVPAASIITEKK